MYLFYVSSTETRINLKYRTFAKNDIYGTGTGTYRHLQKTVPYRYVIPYCMYMYDMVGEHLLNLESTRGKKQEYIYLLEC
jgi:hypothetical protein